MAIITLTTDFGEKDHYVSTVKGAIYSALPDAKIVDVSHHISPFNTIEAAYVISNAYKSFPKGSIHIIGVDSEINPENKHLAIQLNAHYFICANNGIMSMLCAETKPETVVEITIHNMVQSNFPVLDVFVNAACHIARGGTLDVIGKPFENIKPITHLNPFVNDSETQLIGTVIYIDNFGNVITNIKQSFFERVQKGRLFSVHARQFKTNTIQQNYSAIVDFNKPIEKRHDEGKAMALFNSAGYLEIAIYKSNSATVGSAHTLLGLDLMDTITVTFNS